MSNSFGYSSRLNVKLGQDCLSLAHDEEAYRTILRIIDRARSAGLDVKEMENDARKVKTNLENCRRRVQKQERMLVRIEQQAELAMAQQGAGARRNSGDAPNTARPEPTPQRDFRAASPAPARSGGSYHTAHRESAPAGTSGEQQAPGQLQRGQSPTRPQREAGPSFSRHDKNRHSC